MKLTEIKTEKELIDSQKTYLEIKSNNLTNTIKIKESEIQEILYNKLELALDLNDRSHLNNIKVSGIGTEDGLIIEFVLDNLQFKYVYNHDEILIEFDIHSDTYTVLKITDKIIVNLKTQIKKLLKDL